MFNLILGQPEVSGFATAKCEVSGFEPAKCDVRFRTFEICEMRRVRFHTCECTIGRRTRLIRNLPRFRIICPGSELICPALDLFCTTLTATIDSAAGDGDRAAGAGSPGRRARPRGTAAARWRNRSMARVGRVIPGAAGAMSSGTLSCTLSGSSLATRAWRASALTRAYGLRLPCHKCLSSTP